MKSGIVFDDGVVVIKKKRGIGGVGVWKQGWKYQKDNKSKIYIKLPIIYMHPTAILHPEIQISAHVYRGIALILKYVKLRQGPNALIHMPESDKKFICLPP